MSDICLFLEQNCAKSMKRLLCVYPLTAFLVVLDILLFPDDSSLFGILLVLSLGAIAKVHFVRLTEMVKDGALIRMRLLPVKRYAFFISELLFCLASYAGLFLCFYLTWFAYACIVYHVTDASSLLILTWSIPGLDFLFPLSGWNIVVLVFYLIAIAFETLSSSLSFAMKEMKTSLVMTLFVSWNFIFRSETISVGLALFFLVVITVSISYSYYRINRILMLRKKVTS